MSKHNFPFLQHFAITIEDNSVWAQRIMNESFFRNAANAPVSVIGLKPSACSGFSEVIIGWMTPGAKVFTACKGRLCGCF